jgi:predicted transcriptional regulator
MKTSALPPLRVDPALRNEAEQLLKEDETLSAFMLEALKLNIERRKARQDFLTRGLASAAKARDSGDYVPASRVLTKLAIRLAKAKQSRGKP